MYYDKSYDIIQHCIVLHEHFVILYNMSQYLS